MREIFEKEKAAKKSGRSAGSRPGLRKKGTERGS